MCKSTIGLRHLVNIVTLADRTALTLECFHDLGRECGGHRRAFAGIREIYNPTQRERSLTIRRNFERHLIRRTTHAAGLGLNAGLGVVHSALQNFNGVTRRIFLGESFKRTIDDALCRALLAGEHDGVDQSRYENALVFSVLLCGTT